MLSHINIASRPGKPVSSSSAVTRQGKSRRFFARLLFVYAIAGLCSTSVSAGTVSITDSLKHIGFSVNDTETNTTWRANLSNLLTFDSKTGAVSLVPKGTALDANCAWTTTEVYNKQTKTFETKDAIKWWSTETVGEGGPWRSVVTFYATGNVDPFLSYAFSVRNNTNATQTYTYSFGEALVPPVSGGFNIYTDVAGSLTNTATGTTAKVTPTAGPTALQVLKLSADNGGTFTNAAVDVGAALESTTAPGTISYSPTMAAWTGIAAQTWNYWQIDTSFSLSGGGDAFALSGYAELAVIPEPATSAALIGALVLVVALAKRFRRTTTRTT